MRFVIAPLLLAVLAAGCSSVVTGSGSGSGTTTTASPAPTTGRVTTTEDAAVTTTSAPEPTPPVTVDESAPAQYCDRPFTGALGKEMLAVVVETPSGRLTCDQAAAVLVDYYTQRSDPEFGLPPIAIGPLSCNQVPEGSLPQVVCSDEDNVIYSMWQQR